MEAYDVPAKEHFYKEKLALIDFFQLSNNSYFVAESIIEDSKEKFLEKNPSFTETQYITFKHLTETFNKRANLSYVEFADLMHNEYGYFLNEIKEQNSIKLSRNIHTIKNILVFFTWLWSIGAIITVIALYTR